MYGRVDSVCACACVQHQALTLQRNLVVKKVVQTNLISDTLNQRQSLHMHSVKNESTKVQNASVNA